MPTPLQQADMYVSSEWNNKFHFEENQQPYQCCVCGVKIAVTKKDPYIMEQVRKKGPIHCVKCAVKKMDETVVRNQSKEKLQVRLLQMKNKRGKKNG